MMKNTLSFFALFLGLCTLLPAQTRQGQSVIGIQTGFSLAGALFNLSEIDANIDASAPPAVQFTYDYALTDRLSLGGGVSYQRFKLAYSDYGEMNETFDVRLSRFNLAVRGLFHYGNSEAVDMYSGLRVGLSNWSLDVGTDDPNFDPPKASGPAFAPQLVLFGIRGYLAENLAIGGELAAGAPHVLSLGLNYRF
ncbi:MAG: outer membrane beta-barrel protein [Phaeodactylibacter sp.]|nr:outer membrane beta-barrel protein [Phaeodactylibacter sp.]